MSAISGIYQLNNQSVSRADLLQMNQAQHHHGQDGSGIWLDYKCGLAQQISHLTYESLHETLPYVDLQNQITVVAHCRLFNHRELYNQLIEYKDNRIVGDCELIILAYLKWKLDFVAHLVGEFSIALWDKKSQQLLCISDHFNSRPLYYSHIPNKMFVFATEIHSLHQVKDIPRQPNLGKIARNDFLHIQVEEGETCFENVKLLPAASIILVNQKGVTLRQYWQPTLGQQLSFRSDAEFSEAFQAVFSQAVTGVTRSHLPICLQLSGGLDSSAIALIAADVLGKQHRDLICLSNILPETNHNYIKDESDFIQLIKAPNLIKYAVTDEWRGPFDNMGTFSKSLYTNPQHYQYRAIANAARSYQSKIILHGTLGEITASYAGHEYLGYLFRRLRIPTLFHEVFAHMQIYNRSLAAILIRNVIQPNLPIFCQSYLHKFGNMQLTSKHSLINVDFMKKHITKGESDWIRHQLTNRANVHSVDSRKNALIQMKSFLTHTSNLFTQPNDAPLSAVYLSNPYFDKRMVEFCLNTPNQYRFRNGYPRSIIRLGMQSLLPNKICFRTSKGPFLPDYHIRYNQQLPMLRAIVDEFSQSDLVKEVINIKKLKQLLHYSSTSSDLNTAHNFINFQIIPRIVYLGKFLYSF